MKKLLFAFIFLAATAAFGHAGSICSEVAPLQIADHPQHASLTAMASEHRLMGGAADTYNYARWGAPFVGVRSAI